MDNDLPDWQPHDTNLETELKCGYLTVEALAEVDSLSTDQIRRLAAMAVHYFESSWSDSRRDLLRGMACLLRRLPACDRP